MDDVLSIDFVSPLTLDEMHATLTSRFADTRWRLGESFYEGDYVKGETPDGVAVRVLRQGGEYSAETYFPLTEEARRLFSDSQKTAFMLWLRTDVLEALQATSVRPG